MRRFAMVVFMFALGAGLAVGIMRGLDAYRARSAGGAASDLRAVLDRAPAPVDIPATALVTAAARIEPSVVNIDTLAQGRRQGVNIWGEPVLRPFSLQGRASGVIISASGHILTNSHVVADATIIRVTLQTGKVFDGRIVASDPNADLAIVKIDGRGLTPADLGDSDRLKVGEYVLAIGNPLGIGTTVTHGIISATNRRNLQISEGHILREALQTDAAINQGNSGGALANLKGQLIGINTAIASPSGGSIGLGFAIPTNAIRRVLKGMLSGAKPADQTPGDPFIGILYGPVPGDLAVQLGLPPGRGVCVEQVTPLTGAADAGVEAGSVIVAVDGQAITSMDSIRATIGKRHVGDTITLRLVLGDGRQRDTRIRLGRRPAGT